jgi:YihY family inner membrane protein
VSSATKVPETWELTGDDARKTLQETGRRRLVRDAFVRLRAADGFSHARSLAFVTSLVLVQGLIAVVGFTTAFDLRIGREIVAGIQSAVPGPAGHLLTNVVAHAREVGVHHRYLPLLLGLVGTLITGTTAMGQIERGFNRIYGIEKDRPTARKYGRAFLLTLGAGSGLALAFFVFAIGRRSDTANSVLHSTWPWVRWPLGLAVAMLALSALLRWSPRRRQPEWSWLMFGAFVCVGGWVLVTVALSLALNASSNFGTIYGPLAGIVALQLWTFFSAIAIFFGAAVAAQLEAVRAGQPQPREQVDESIPRARDTSYAS